MHRLSNIPLGDVVLLCSGSFGGGSGKRTPRYCRSMDIVGSRELNFIPTTKMYKKQSMRLNIYILHYKHDFVYCIMEDFEELTFLQNRMDDLSVFENREVLQQIGPKSDHLLLISLWNELR